MKLLFRRDSFISMQSHTQFTRRLFVFTHSVQKLSFWYFSNARENKNVDSLLLKIAHIFLMFKNPINSSSVFRIVETLRAFCLYTTLWLKEQLLIYVVNWDLLHSFAKTSLASFFVKLYENCNNILTLLLWTSPKKSWSII